MMPNGFRLQTLLGLACVLAACANGSSAAPERLDSEVCAVASGAQPLAGVPEASGAALSRRTPGLIWSFNDSGRPELWAFDTSGTERGRVRIPNATVDDWEDVTSAPCAGGSCLYVADIGDNNRARRRITVYRIPEPLAQDEESAAADVFTATYPDGPHDAEALFVTAENEMFILTKASTATLYRFPQPLRAGAEMRLERVAELPLSNVTDAETSADGAWVAVRTKDVLAFYRPADLVRGGPPAATVSLSPLNEPQGEGVALDEDGMVYLTSEGGRAGSLVVLRCRV